MRSGARIGVVIPALNEEPSIGRAIRDIPTWVDEVVVADNRSTDATAEIATRAGAKVVLERERGYGAACQAGIEALGDVDIIVFMDADCIDVPQEMDKLVDPILAGTAELVIGSRVLGHAAEGALMPHQRFGNWMACSLIRLAYGSRFTDLGPFRAVKSSTLGTLDMRDRNYGWTVEMQIKAAQRRLAVREVPVSYRCRIGTSKISGTLLGSTKAAFVILSLVAQSMFARANTTL